MAYSYTPFVGSGSIRPADLSHWPDLVVPMLFTAVSLGLLPPVLNGLAGALGGEGGFAAGSTGTLLILSAGQILALLIVLIARNAILAIILTAPAVLWGVWLCYAEMRALHGLPRLKAAGTVFLASLAWLALSSPGRYATKRQATQLTAKMTQSMKNVSWPAAVQPGAQGQVNAMQEYRRAASLSVEQTGSVSGVIREGWRDPDGSLATLVQRNQRALALFRHAAYLPFCDFTEGKFAVITSSTAIPPLRPEVSLARVLLLEGKEYEAHGQYDKAMDDYVPALLFARQSAQQRNWALLYSTLYRLIANYCCDALWSYVARDLGSSAAYEKLIKTLDYLSYQKPTLAEVYRSESAMLAASSAQLVEAESRMFRPLLAEKMIQENKEFLARLVDRLAASADQNAPEVWDNFCTEDLVKRNRWGTGPNSGLLLAAHADGPAWTAYLVASGIPIYGRFTIEHYLVQSRLNLLETGAAIRAYEHRYGKAPPNLEALTPAFLKKIPKDPFNGFRPLRYVPEAAGGWTLYGLGPSRKDGGAATAYAAESASDWYKTWGDWKKAPPGEIILRGAPASRPAPSRPVPARRTR